MFSAALRPGGRARRPRALPNDGSAPHAVEVVDPRATSGRVGRRPVDDGTPARAGSVGVEERLVLRRLVLGRLVYLAAWRMAHGGGWARSDEWGDGGG